MMIICNDEFDYDISGKINVWLLNNKKIITIDVIIFLLLDFGWLQ